LTSLEDSYRHLFDVISRMYRHSSLSALSSCAKSSKSRRISDETHRIKRSDSCLGMARSEKERSKEFESVANVSTSRNCLARFSKRRSFRFGSFLLHPTSLDSTLRPRYNEQAAYASLTSNASNYTPLISLLSFETGTPLRALTLRQHLPRPPHLVQTQQQAPKELKQVTRSA